jgi:hypothetical protein
MALLTTNHTSNIASLYLSSLLTWKPLPTLLALNSERLSDSWQLLAQKLKQWDIRFIAPTHGIFVFAKLAKNARTAKDEIAFFDRLAIKGVRVGLGHFYKGVEGDFGWARIRFSIPVDMMKKALATLATFLASEGYYIS